MYKQLKTAYSIGFRSGVAGDNINPYIGLRAFFWQEGWNQAVRKLTVKWLRGRV